jgi:Uma2 family endonuclease
MATVAPTQPTISSPPPSRTPPLHRITVDEYERIIASGALENPGRVELIDGYMVDKTGKNADHRWTTKEVLKALDRRLPPGWTSQKEEPVRIPEYDEPEPDIAIIRGSDDDYRHRLPTADDVTLVVEVSDSTLRQDRGKKRTAYAKYCPTEMGIGIREGEAPAEPRTGSPGGSPSRGIPGPFSVARY